eukprot:CAMPEP_0183714194 /NCGR_PEP_ID=MMETSP0737-20130205/8812_1 /TAXON_ID=385413 /ORGANISM="Thalassiosira miniscula, Strain CCMP1093" /LENGTH=158 /DNA_ID=CAMNT_0025943099 /DNA_START=165 /DNA_END=638 /DNA_ORIENTATION=+
MIRAFQLRTNATAVARAWGVAPTGSLGGTCNQKINEITKSHPLIISGSHHQISRHSYHGTAIHPKSTADVYVTLTSQSNESSSHDDTQTQQSTPHNSMDDNSSESACSQGIPMEDDEEDDQEEMFVTADPILGHGNIQEWGGPRRGGRLEEPTRFGDW